MDTVLPRSTQGIVRNTGRSGRWRTATGIIGTGRRARLRPPSPPPQTHPAGRTSSSSSATTWGSPTWARSAARSRRRTSTRWRRTACASRTSTRTRAARPTRSMLLSGVDTHLNGLGNMDEWTAPNQRGVDGYEGYLNNRVVTLPQLLKDAGYHTYMVGKWHLGKAPDTDPGRARIRARLLAARRGGQLLGHDEFHGRFAAVGLHRGRALSDASSPRTTTRRRPTPTS